MAAEKAYDSTKQLWKQRSNVDDVITVMFDSVLIVSLSRSFLYLKAY